MNPQTPKNVVMAVVVLIGVVTLAMIVGVFVLVFHGDKVPGEVWPLIGGGVGGLTALLASTRSTETPVAK